jgi:HAD superfamily hydrolase (TIGR01509 family)
VTAGSRLPAAVLFDLDGTLIDTEPVWMAQEQQLVAEFGGIWTTDQARSMIGTALPAAGARLRDEGGVDLPVEAIVDRLVDRVEAAVRLEVPWQPGARQLLGRLTEAGIPLALVTMSYRRLVAAFLRDVPAGTFGAVVTGDEVSQGKPHPEPYLTAARMLGVDAADCVVVEDSRTGVVAGVTAGARVLAVRASAPLDGLVAGVPVLASLDEVARRILPEQVSSLP